MTHSAAIGLFTLLFCLPLWHKAQFEENQKAQTLHAKQITEDAVDTKWAKNMNIEKGATACQGLKGEVYKSWLGSDSLYFQKSLDGGKTWPELKMGINPVKNALAFTVNGLTIKGRTAMACDTSKGEFNGRIYIAWSEEKHGAKNKDVFLVYSDDKGAHWTEPILVSYRPNHKEQFKPQLSVDKNGRLYILYFDGQNYLVPGLFDLYAALSDNGGLKFDYYRINKNSIDLNKYAIAEANMRINPGNEAEIQWFIIDKNGLKQTRTAKITESRINDYNTLINSMPITSERSFFGNEEINVPFVSATDLSISASITNPLEPGPELIVFKNRLFKKGNNTLKIEAKKLGFKRGTYTLNLYFNNRNTFVWLTVSDGVD